MAELAAVLAETEHHLPDSLARLFQLLRFASVGTDPRYHGECRQAAEWLATLTQGWGFETRLAETTGRPLVLAQWKAAPDQRHRPGILFYGHYDVQPADPLEKWSTSPFAPEIRKDDSGQERIFARGASDDKGQIMTFMEAVRAWLAVHGSLPCSLTIMLEGDEEGDSSHLRGYLAAHARDFPVDCAFICDTELWKGRTPAITTSLRGVIDEEVIIEGPYVDLHSGYYGGPAANPIKVLSRIMADIHDSSGRVTIPGFYERVRGPSRKIRQEWQKLGFSERSFLKEVGLSQPAGEKKFSALEQLWARPTAEFNGILGGYTGAGSKTVLPARAMAKFSFRLVAGQEPEKIRKAFRTFVKARLPAGCRARFQTTGGGSIGVSVSETNPWINLVGRALQQEWRRKPILIGNGASIPAVEDFKTYLKTESVLVGFATDQDGAHSPNESYRVDNFRRGIRSWVRVLGEMAKI